VLLFAEDLHEYSDTNFVLPRILVAKEVARAMVSPNPRTKSDRNHLEDSPGAFLFPVHDAEEMIHINQQTPSNLSAKDIEEDVFESYVNLDIYSESNFEDNYEEMFRAWVSLLKETTFSRNTTSSDKRVINAFSVINNVFENQNTPHLLLRLAYLRFNEMVRTLQLIAQKDRQHRRIDTAVGHRNASIAVDICLASQQQQLDRKEALRRIRHAKRWACLIGSSRLALSTCSDEAEKIM
jgi:RNA processing factor Prp31